MVNQLHMALPLDVRPDGYIRVIFTRVGLEQIIKAWRSGSTPQQIAASYSTVPLKHVYQIIGYILEVPHEIDRYMCFVEERENEAVAAHPEWQPEGLKAKLLERRESLHRPS